MSLLPRKNSKASPRNTERRAAGGKRLKIAVLAGGPSNEREVSLKSAAQIIKALSKGRHSASLVEIPKKGEWPSWKTLKGFDVAFIAMHGKFGEDGRPQAFLELAGIPYTGSGVLASALGMDKVRTLEMAERNGICVPKQLVLDRALRGAKAYGKYESMIVHGIGIPCVVKPSRSGSSIGVAIVRERKALKKAIEGAFHEDDTVIVQQYIKGREITCGVMGNTGRTPVVPLPPVEIVAAGDFFDYRAKYIAAETREICPAPIGTKLTKEIQRLAVQAHEMLGCDGVTRSDFILVPDGKMYFLEINTIPGLTEASLLPKEAAVYGMEFGDFLEFQISLALEKHKK